MSDVELHTDEAHAAITAELVRLTLGGRGPDRPELRTAGRFASELARLGRKMGELFRATAAN